jgi:hypothetical protein
MSTTTKTPVLSRTEGAALLAEMQALHALVAERIMPRAAGGIDLRRCTPDELLDAWIAVRGLKAEAHLLSRIYKRRAARRAAL